MSIIEKLSAYFYVRCLNLVQISFKRSPHGLQNNLATYVPSSTYLLNRSKMLARLVRVRTSMHNLGQLTSLPSQVVIARFAVTATVTSPRPELSTPASPAPKQKKKKKQAPVQNPPPEEEKPSMKVPNGLVPYLELCVFSGDVHRALKTINYYRLRGKGVVDITAYNVVLHGFAAKGNLSKVKEVFKLILDDQLPPSPQTYAAMLEALGRSLHTSHCARNIRLAIESFKSYGFVLNDLFNHCVFERDQREMVLAAIWKIDPSFRPQVSTPYFGYVCPLLEHLNDSQPDSNYVSPSDGITRDQVLKNASQQLCQEMDGQITIPSIVKKDNTYNSFHYEKLVQDMESMWISTIKMALERDINSLTCQSQWNHYRWSITLLPFLKVLKTEDYVKIIMQEIKTRAEGSETYSPVVSQLYKDLGQRVLSRYQILQKKEAGIFDKVNKLFQVYIDWYLNPKSDPAVNPRQKWQSLIYDATSEGPHVDVPEKVWPVTILNNIGHFLYNIILQDIKINVNIMKNGECVERLVPAFYSIYRMQGTHMKEEIKPHPVLVKLFQLASPEKLTFDTTLTPMICPPLPWSSIRTGGYLLSATKIIRVPYSAQQQMNRLHDCQPETLYPALDSLNQLGAVPWKVNEDILDIMIQVFNNKGNDLIGIAPPPSECPVPPSVDSSMSKEEVVTICKQRALYRRQKAEMYSLWCDALYRLSLANYFRKDVFWFPHNMDFRGRVYPCPPHLNHLGADTARAILVFAKGEPLGPNGLDWLKIHMINLTGLKKKNSILDRLNYANEIMDDVLDSAENPLTGRKWWMESDEPWQTLSCCVEISKALKSGDPESYVSGFPIHQDGSCNGLQHYAALGRDSAGAESVNLSPSHVPQDVYSAVVSLVENQRQIDANNGVEIAKALEGFIKRKIIKQTVMTTVYGVTRYGARQQIAKQLKDVIDFPKDLVWPASIYLTVSTFNSLQEMFTSTKEIQDWFTECARLISHTCWQNVEWVTPLGFPIVQPYTKQFKSPIPILYTPNRLPESKSTDEADRPNTMKQRNAFPPNFIHSLDSSHMMLTSINAERAGITFISVHDCYWTHPRDVHIMNQICREQFVALHSEPILEDLSKFLAEKYSFKDEDLIHNDSGMEQAKTKLNSLLARVPPKGTFDLNNVLKSVYFFS